MNIILCFTLRSKKPKKKHANMNCPSTTELINSKYVLIFYDLIVKVTPEKE